MGVIKRRDRNEVIAVVESNGEQTAPDRTHTKNG